MVEYAGGLADWLDHGGEVATGPAAARPVTTFATRPAATLPADGAVTPAGPAAANAALSHPLVSTKVSLGDRLMDSAVLDRNIGELIGAWLAIVLGFGLAFWAADLVGTPWISVDEVGRGSLADLGNAMYFSFVTALTIGYGDISPLGPARVLAIIEGAAGLLIFGIVISKLVSRRQEQLAEDTHRIAFEQRLGRVRTSLHLVLSELQVIATMCAEKTTGADRIRLRAESTLAIFEGELQTVHDLLYNPEQVPDEQALESILASIAAGLEVLNELLGCMPRATRDSQLLRTEIRNIHIRAVEICADCVPRDYTHDLAAWMDRVQQEAEKLG